MIILDAVLFFQTCSVIRMTSRALIKRNRVNIKRILFVAQTICSFQKYFEGPKAQLEPLLKMITPFRQPI